MKKYRIDVINNRIVKNIYVFDFVFILDDIIDVENKKISGQELRSNDHSFEIF